VLEDELLDGNPTQVAEFHGPVLGERAARVEDRVPFLHIGLGDTLAISNLFGQPSRQLGGQKDAHFSTRHFFFEGEIQIHVNAP